MTSLRWLLIGYVAAGGFYALTPMQLVWDRELGARSVAASHAGSGRALRALLPDFTESGEHVGPTMVNITTRAGTSAFAGIAERHFDVYRGLAGAPLRPREPEVNIGSDFILDHDGYAPTSAHDARQRPTTLSAGPCAWRNAPAVR